MRTHYGKLVIFHHRFIRNTGNSDPMVL
jgi:hypothetical protein